MVDGVHGVVCQSVICRECGKCPLVVPRSTVGSPEPDGPRFILTDCLYPITCETILGGQRSKGSSIVTGHTAALRTKPEYPVTISKYRLDTVMSQSIDRGESRETAPIVSGRTAALRTKPEVTLGIWTDRLHPIVCQTILRRKGDEREPIIPGNPFPRAKPKISVRILQHRQKSLE